MNDQQAFEQAVILLANGDFSRLDPFFEGDPAIHAERPSIVIWHGQGRLGREPGAVGEALSCACFLGRVRVAEYLLRQGADPCGGAATGLNAFHWAVNRGQLDIVKLLLQYRCPTGVLSRYGGNVVDTAIWSAIHEPKPDHLAVLELLLESGARPSPGASVTGHPGVDALVARFT